MKRRYPPLRTQSIAMIDHGDHVHAPQKPFEFARRIAERRRRAIVVDEDVFDGDGG
jgi:hypothetical protein